MTWIEVAADAVKIGLGALLGGAFAIVAARQAYNIRQLEEYSRRRRDQLERISESFEAATRDMIGQVLYINSLKTASNPAEAREAIAAAFGDNISSDPARHVQVCQELLSIEARLALLALPHISEELAKIRQTLGQLLSENSGIDTKEEREKLTKRLALQQGDIFTLLATAYKNA